MLVGRAFLCTPVHRTTQRARTTRDNQDIHSAAVSAMLLNEFLEEHKKVQEHRQLLVNWKSNATNQEATVRELTTDVTSEAAGRSDPRLMKN